MVRAIAVDPSNPDVLLAGTESDFSEGIPKEIYRSEDAGSTWALVYRGTTTSGGVVGIVFDPLSPDIVLAAPDILIRSADGGRTWTSANDGVLVTSGARVQVVAFDPLVRGRVYLGTAGSERGTVYRSDDGATTWSQPSSGVCENGDGPYCDLANGPVSLTVDPSGKVYLGVNFTGSVLTSEDGGVTWTYSLKDNGGYRGLTVPLLVDRFDPSSVFGQVGGGSGVEASFVESRDGGATWVRADAGLPVPLNSGSLIQSPLDGTLFLSGARGPDIGSVWRRRPGETAWTEVGPEPVLTVYFGLAVSTTRGVLYGGGDGVWSSTLVATNTEASPCGP